MTTTQPHTDQTATDEALLLFVRKVSRLHPAAHADVIARLPEGARWALELAQQRADKRRAEDLAAGIVREYVDPFEVEGDESDEDAFHATAQPNALGTYIGCDGPRCSAAEAALVTENLGHKIQGV